MSKLSSKTLILAPWGNPNAWGITTYSFKYGEKEERARSKTSLEAIAKVFEDSHILVFIVDTLAVNFDIAGKECYEGLRRLVLDGVKRCIVDSLEAETLTERLKDNVLNLELVPGIGEFRGWKFGQTEGYKDARRVPSLIESYEAEVFAVMFNRLIELEPENVVVDLTHGINYMPATFYEAAKTATEAYSVYSNKDVRLIYLNSEPYSKDASLLNIHVVVEETFSPKSSLDRIAHWMDLFLRKEGNLQLSIASLVSKEKAKEIGKELNDIRDRFSYIYLKGLEAARGILFSMPLAILYLANEIKEFRPFNIVKDINYIRDLRNRETTIRDKKIFIPLLFSLDRTKALIYSASLLNYILKITSDIKDFDISKVKKSGAPLDLLRKLSESLGSTYRAVAEHEIDNLRKGCLNLDEKISCEIEIAEGSWPEKECDSSSAVTRNIKAHAGLERNMVEGLRVGSEIYLRYRLGKEDCWNVLQGLLRSPNF